MSARKAKNVVMLVGGAWHPWQACGKVAKEMLEATGRYGVAVTEDRDILAGGLSAYDAVIIYAQGGEMTPAQEKGLLEFVRAGGALVAVHCANTCFRNSRKYISLVGSQFKAHPPGLVSMKIQLVDPAHQATTRLGDFEIADEMYQVQNVADDVHILAVTRWLGEDVPVMYARTEGQGRVFYTALGHGVEQFKHPQFRKSLLHGLDWACRLEPKAGPIRCAMLGYGGAFGMGKAHSDMINATAGMQAVAACDTEPARLVAARNEFPNFKTYSTADAMLADEDIDLAVIILPHNLHFEYAMKCLAAGKHVVLEKPFCLTVAEADQMIALAREKELMLSVFHNRRWDGDYLTIRRLIEEGAIGEVFEITCGTARYGEPRVWWRSEKAVSGGALYDWGAHFVDWVLGIIPDKIVSVNGFFHKKVWMQVTAEDHTQALVRFAGGQMADVVISSISAAPRPRWRILGTRGAILDDGSVTDASGKSIGCKVTTYRNGSMVTSQVIWGKGQHHEYYWNVADHLLLGDELAVKPEQARRVIGVIEYAERSSKSGKPEMFEGETS